MSAPINQTIHLVQQAKSGETAALNLLLDRYTNRILRIVRARLGAKLRGRIESMDIVQEVMIRAFKSFEKFELKDESAFLRWLSQLVNNEIRDQADFHGAAMRDVNAEHQKKTNEDRSVLSDLAAQSLYRPSFQLNLKTEVLELEGALDKLEEQQREVIIMRQYEEMSFKEIGQIFSISEDAARMQYARALNRLTSLMQNQDE